MIAGLITGFASAPVGATVSVGGFVLSYSESSRIYNAAKGGGITVVTTTIYGPMEPGVPNAGVNVEIRDSNGKVIIRK